MQKLGEDVRDLTEQMLKLDEEWSSTTIHLFRLTSWPYSRINMLIKRQKLARAPNSWPFEMHDVGIQGNKVHWMREKHED